jgi:hypothetical protein
VAQLLPGKMKYRYLNMTESQSYDYEESLLKDIEDSQVKCVLVLEHFTFEKAQVILSLLKVSLHGRQK